MTLNLVISKAHYIQCVSVFAAKGELTFINEQCCTKNAVGSQYFLDKKNIPVDYLSRNELLCAMIYDYPISLINSQSGGHKIGI